MHRSRPKFCVFSSEASSIWEPYKRRYTVAKFAESNLDDIMLECAKSGGGGFQHFISEHLY